MKRLTICISIAMGLGLALGLLWVLRQLPPALASPSGTTRYVAPTGDDSGNLCTSPITPCRTVQQAVNLSWSGDDEVLVAAGTYTATSGQVLFIQFTVVIRGGYNANFSARDPQGHPTILDGRRQMRVIYIMGSVSPTLDGLIVTGGNASNAGSTGFGGGIYSSGADPIIVNSVISDNVAYTSTASSGHGGGIYLQGTSASALISGNLILNNVAGAANAGYGGGLYLDDSDATLSGNTVQSNTASLADYGEGGGLYLGCSDATLSGNMVQSNTASTVYDGAGGGLYIEESDATLSGNTVRGNTAGASNGYGGGLYVNDSKATLSGNSIVGNTACEADSGDGGGLYVASSDATLSGNTIVNNVASAADWGEGGGAYLTNSTPTLSGNTIVSNTATLSATATGMGGGLTIGFCRSFTLTNNLVADNHANTQGSGLAFKGALIVHTSGRLLHTTIADNRGSGQGVSVGDYTTVAFTNTIIAGHDSVGITVTTGSTVTLTATLWHNSGPHTDGGGTVISSINLTGDPAFANPAAWDYHLSAASPAIDAGVEAGVTSDIDGDPRSSPPDLGADEYMQFVYLPLVLRNH
jgi:hypothetical protein